MRPFSERQPTRDRIVDFQMTVIMVTLGLVIMASDVCFALVTFGKSKGPLNI